MDKKLTTKILYKMNSCGADCKSVSIMGLDSHKGPNFMYFTEKIVSSALKTISRIREVTRVDFCGDFTRI